MLKLTMISAESVKIKKKSADMCDIISVNVVKDVVVVLHKKQTNL